MCQHWHIPFCIEVKLTSYPAFQGSAATGFDAGVSIADKLCQLSGGLCAA